MLTAAQIRARRKYIGGSEVAAILGLSPFQTAAGLYDEKMGLVEPKPTSDAMLTGIFLEDGIAKLWRHRKCPDTSMKKHGPRLHPEFRFMRASPDRILWAPHATVMLEGLEVKCISSYSEAAGGWGRSGSQDYPEYYKAQCAWNRMIFDLPCWNLIALVADGRYTIKHYRYTTDLAYEKSLRDAACDFWFNNIKKKIRPAEKPVHRLTSPDPSDIVSSKLPDIAPAWMSGDSPTTQYATTLPKEEEKHE